MSQKSILSFLRARGKDRFPKQLLTSLTTGCLTDITNKASQAIQSPRTVPFFFLASLLDGYSFPNVLVKGIVAFKH